MNVVGKPTIGSFSIPTQTLGASTYTITNPTSNSTGAFTYTSSNTSVATVSGNVITLKAVGTSTITATQAADASYLQGSATTILTIDYAGPTTAAAVPTPVSADVISLWGDKYTNVTGTTWNPFWGQNPAVITSTISVGGKTTLKYSSLTYEGVQFSNTINASSMNLLHFDVWTPNCTNFDLYLINTSNGDNQLVTVTPSANGWNSINIPLSSYSRIANHVDQFKIVANAPSSGGVLYLQNIYFVKATPTWTGAVSTDYSLATNWQYGLTPISTNTINIPSGIVKQPSLVANTTVAGITLNGSLSLNGNTLTVTGAVTGSGSLSGSTTSSLVIAGTVGTINFNSSANKLQNLTITSGSATLGNALNVYGTFTPTAGTINTGGNLTLKSTSIANTAVVGVVGGAINGTVTVERFIPAGKRTFRDIGAEVSNAGSVYSNWQEAGTNNNGYGIQITGTQGSSVGTDPTTGFDYSATGNHSLFTYTNNAWDSVMNTKSVILSPYTGYRILIRGDRSGDLQTQLSYMRGDATIRAKGNLVTGNVTFSNLTSGASNYSFVANPYVSPVSWGAVVSASQNINGSFWYCDPTFTDANGYTTFIAYNNVNGVSNPLGLSHLDGYLQPGQAFFVQNAVSGTPQLKFTEACKVPAQGKTAIFGSTTLNRIATGLYKNGNNIDGAVAVFNANNSSLVGNEDSKKFPNHGENLAFTQSGSDLCINGYSMPKATDVLPIHLTNLAANTSYTVRFDASQYSNNSLQAFVLDNVTSAKTMLTGDNTTISFTTNASNAASFANRFSVVFGTTTLPVASINLTATAKASGVAINWTVVGATNVVNYTLEYSTNGTDFNALTTQKASNSLSYSYADASTTGTVYYRVKATDNVGTVCYSKIVSLKLGAITAQLSVFPNPVSGNSFNLDLGKLAVGKYTVSIYNRLGQQVFSKAISHGTSIEKVSLDKHLAMGVYTLKATDAKGTSYQTAIEIK